MCLMKIGDLAKYCDETNAERAAEELSVQVANMTTCQHTFWLTPMFLILIVGLSIFMLVKSSK